MKKNIEIIIDEAKALGLSVEILHKKKHVVRISSAIGRDIIIQELFAIQSDTVSEGMKFAKDKWITHLLWERDGIPTPKTILFDAKEERMPIDASFPVVLKDRNGSKSRNIHTNIRNHAELDSLIDRYPEGGLIQEMIFGKEYRVLVFGERVLGVLEMIPPTITGNGKDSVLELIKIKNVVLHRPIRLNKEMISALQKNKFSVHSVLPADYTINLKEYSCLSEGGVTVDRTDEIHPDLAALATKAARSVHLKLSGIDLKCTDISLKPTEQKIFFLEANGHPSLNIHYEPDTGKPRAVAKEILTDIFPETL